MAECGEIQVLVSVESAAQQLSIGRTTAWALIKLGVLKTTSIGRRTLVQSSSIKKLAETGVERVTFNE